jgi:hypothetical protein
VPKSPAVQFTVTLLVSEDGDALAGEVGVLVGTERMWHERLDAADVETTAEMALRNALKRGREYLEAQSQSNGDLAPPTQPRRPARRRAQPGKVEGATTVSRSRRL